MSEGKEKPGHMTVAMIGCLGTIAAAIITGVASLIIALLPPRSAPTPPITPTVAPSVLPSTSSPQAPATVLMPVPSSVFAGEVDVSGVWQGYLTYVLGDRITNFRYQLELFQNGSVISGKSRVEMIGDASSFAEYLVGAQLIVEDGQITLQVSETDLSNYNNYTSFVPSDPVVAKIMRLVYSATQDKQTLEGEWRDYVGRNMPDGRIQLSRQP